jgi:hypothetical protein
VWRFAAGVPWWSSGSIASPGRFLTCSPALRPALVARQSALAPAGPRRPAPAARNALRRRGVDRVAQAAEMGAPGLELLDHRAPTPQRHELQARCCAILEEHASGADRSRPVLARLLREIPPRDVPRLRPGRSPAAGRKCWCWLSLIGPCRCAPPARLFTIQQGACKRPFAEVASKAFPTRYGGAAGRAGALEDHERLQNAVLGAVGP